MCGRYVLYRSLSDWRQQVGVGDISVDQLPFTWPPPRYNIAPTSDVVCVYIDAEVPQVRVPILQRWGLIPFWADDPAIGNRMINARSETVHEKPSFRNAFKRRRCLIIADGYYEWQRTAAGKQPHFIYPRDGVLAMAGLWEENSKAFGDGSSIRTCTIITTRANDLTGQVHDRMPVIIRDEDQQAWLDPDHEDVDSLRDLFTPAAEDALRMHPVTRAVGNVRNQGAKLIEPVAADS